MSLIGTDFLTLAGPLFLQNFPIYELQSQKILSDHRSPKKQRPQSQKKYIVFSTSHKMIYIQYLIRKSMPNLLRELQVMAVNELANSRLLQEQYLIDRRENQKIRLIAIIITGVIAGCLLIAIIGCCFRSHKCCRICNCWLLRKNYWRFRKRHNIPSAEVMKEEEFDKRVKWYVQLINRSPDQTNFTFLKAGLQHATRASAYVVKLEPFLYDLFLDGQDFEGTYQGKGSIVCREAGPLIWFFKDYDDKKKAQQEGDFQDLVFESFYISRKGIGGKWFHAGRSSTEMNSGKWKIVDSMLVPITNTQKHLMEDVHMDAVAD